IRAGVMSAVSVRQAALRTMRRYGVFGISAEGAIGKTDRGRGVSPERAPGAVPPRPPVDVRPCARCGGRVAGHLRPPSLHARPPGRLRGDGRPSRALLPLPDAEPRRCSAGLTWMKEALP